MQKNENVKSLEAIPPGLIPATDLAVYLKRAFAGQTVYAYESATGIWNIWDGHAREGWGERIELGVAK